MEKACVRVQGQYDELFFDMTVVNAYGGTQAAQTARALGRSGRVVGKLLELDVPTHKIDERPPGDKPSFRGVHIQLFVDCLGSAVPHMKKEAN